MSSFHVTISDTSKDGEVVKFTVITKTKESEESEGGKIVIRQYEDFEYLLHNLTTKNDVSGVIVPSLPPKPLILPSNFESKVKLSTPATTTVAGDNYTQDGKRFEKFLQDLVKNKTFCEDEVLVNFLTEEKPAVRAAVKRGILDSFFNVVDNARYHHYKDTDEEFQSRRDTTNAILLNTKQTHAAKERMKIAENVCNQQYGSFALNCRNAAPASVQNSKEISRFLGRFADVFDEIMIKNQSSTFIMDDSFGFAVELYSRYIQACQEMLFRRTCRLVKLDTSTKALEKATPKNREQLLTAKEEANQSFEEISEKAKAEFESFEESRIEYMRNSLVDLADRQIQVHRESCDVITSALNELRDSM